MDAGKRPGGLTALAVFNFIGAAALLLGAMGFMALPALLENAPPTPNPQQQAQIEALTELGTTPLYLIAARSLIVAVLLLVSGIGYLKVKKFLGRTLGNAYAIVSIVLALPMMIYAPAALGGGFSLTGLLSFLYPVITLVLLNTTFKEDFVN
jgi:uncharacterized membrane protein (DUF2068 family)